MKYRKQYTDEEPGDGPGRINDQSELIDVLKGIIKSERKVASDKRDLIKNNLDALVDLRIVRVSIDQRAIDRY